MREQYTGAISIESRSLQKRAEQTGLVQFRVMHTDELQSVDIDPLVIQHSNSRPLHRFEIFAAIEKFLMIAGDKIDSRRRRNVFPRFQERIKIRRRTIEHIAAD